MHEEIGLGGIKAQALTPLQVTKWREALKNTKTSCGCAGLSPRSISASVGTLKAACKWAALNRLIPRDPIAAVGHGKLNMAVKPKKAWTGAEAKKFLAFPASDRLNPIWQLALVGRLRRGEMSGLKWEDIDFNKSTVRIARTRVTVNGHPQDSEPKTKGDSPCAEPLRRRSVAEKVTTADLPESCRWATTSVRCTTGESVTIPDSA